MEYMISSDVLISAKRKALKSHYQTGCIIYDSFLKKPPNENALNR